MGSARPRLRSLLAHKAGTADPCPRPAATGRGVRGLVVALVIGWFALIAAGCLLLANSQANSRNGMAARLQTRSQLAANFVSIYAGVLVSRQRAQAFSWFATSRVTQDTLDRDVSALGLEAAVLVDAHGRELRTSTAGPPSLVQLLVRRFTYLADPATGPEASGVVLTDIGGSPLLSFRRRVPEPLGPSRFHGRVRAVRDGAAHRSRAAAVEPRLEGVPRRRQRRAALERRVARAGTQHAGPSRSAPVGGGPTRLRAART